MSIGYISTISHLCGERDGCKRSQFHKTLRGWRNRDCVWAELRWSKWTVGVFVCMCCNYLWHVVFLCVLSSHIWLRRHAVPPEWDREHNYCPSATSPRKRGSCQVRKSSQMYILDGFFFYTKHGLLKVHIRTCVQYVPGGGWRGDREESEEGAGASGVFPTAHVPRWGAGPGHATLLHSRAATQQPPGGQSLHCGRQSHLQRLLEQPFGSTQKLPCLLPGYEQLQRGEWTNSVPVMSGVN